MKVSSAGIKRLAIEDFNLMAAMKTVAIIEAVMSVLAVELTGIVA